MKKQNPANINGSNYFTSIGNGLKKKSTVKTTTDKITFSTLKILEYWVRILQQSPECLNNAVAIRLMDENHTIDYVNNVIELFKPLLNTSFQKNSQKKKIGRVF